MIKSQRIICPDTGIDYASKEDMFFYKLLCYGEPKDALVFAALNYKKIGTYALDRAIDEFNRREIIRGDYATAKRCEIS